LCKDERTLAIQARNGMSGGLGRQRRRSGGDTGAAAEQGDSTNEHHHISAALAHWFSSPIFAQVAT
jgi:hypothetical protein